MIKGIKALLLGGTMLDPAQDRVESDELQVAAAALLVEAAMMDAHFDESEQATIEALLKRRFALGEDEMQALLRTARERVEQSSQLFAFTRVINDRFDADERIELMEMLWQVVYADGRVTDYESNLMRRVAGLIHVSDRDSGAARKRALAGCGGAG